jgi:alkyldihydroxyacetonephosphate synthase
MEKANEKLKVVRDNLGQIISVEPKFIDLDENCPVKLKYDYFRKDGWGFKDTKIIFDPKKKEGFITGSRYTFSGSTLKDLYKFAVHEWNFNLDEPPIVPQSSMPVDPPYVNEAFIADIKGFYSRLSFDDAERTLHSHGHTLREVYALKHGKFERFADCVVFPGCHEHVEGIVKAAVKHNVVLIPYGGGTNVTQALLLSAKEKRMIVSVDTTRVSLSVK